MNKEFISSNEVINIKFYGLNFRLNCVMVEDKSLLWIVSMRTATQKRQDWIFNDANDAITKIKELLVTEIKSGFFKNL